MLPSVFANLQPPGTFHILSLLSGVAAQLPAWAWRAMAHFSLERVLSPVPMSAFPAVSEILSSIPSHLSPPFLQKVLETKHEVNLSLKQVENVLWKIETFLPCMVSVSHPLGQNPFQLKKYQELVPDVPTVCVPSLVTSCACCAGALEDKAGRSSSRLVNNLRGRLVSNHHKHPKTMFDCLIFNLIRTGYVMFDYPKAARTELASSQKVSKQSASSL